MHITQATPRAARSLARDIREVDRREWELGTGQPFLGQLLAGLLTKGSHNYALWSHDDCLAVFGVHPTHIENVGRAWFAGANGLMPKLHEAHSYFREGIGLLHEHSPVLIASSWHANGVHHRWMERMGFTLDGPEFVGREVFYTYSRIDQRTR